MGGSGRTTRILFVCLGNICRSPLAHVVMAAKVRERGLANRVAVDSCGTGNWQVGGGADPGSVAVAAGHGLDLSPHRARQLSASDGEDFDWIVCMDASNLRNVHRMLPGRKRSVIRLRDHDPEGSGNVPDPWARGPEAFEEVYRIVERCCEALLDAIQAREGR